MRFDMHELRDAHVVLPSAVRWHCGTLLRSSRAQLLDARPPARQASHKGLTTTEAADRIKIYGYNKLPEETRNPILVSIPAVRGGALALHE